LLSGAPPPKKNPGSAPVHCEYTVKQTSAQPVMKHSFLKARNVGGRLRSEKREPDTG